MTRRQCGVVEATCRLHAEPFHYRLRAQVGCGGKRDHLTQLKRAKGELQRAQSRFGRITLSPVRVVQAPTNFNGRRAWERGRCRLQANKSYELPLPDEFNSPQAPIVLDKLGGDTVGELIALLAAEGAREMSHDLVVRIDFSKSGTIRALPPA